MGDFSTMRNEVVYFLLVDLIETDHREDCLQFLFQSGGNLVGARIVIRGELRGEALCVYVGWCSKEIYVRCW